MPGLEPPFLAGMPRFKIDSTVEIDPAKATWQTNSLRFPPKSRGGAQASIAVQPMPQGKIFSAAWRGKVAVRNAAGCGMYSLRFLLDGLCVHTDGRQTFGSEPNLFTPPDQPFRGSFENLRLLFIDISPTAVERAFGSTPRGGIGLRALDRGRVGPLRHATFAAMRELELLPVELRPKFLRNFQNVTAAGVAALLREMLPSPRAPAAMIGRRKVADLCEWAALDHEDPLTVGDLAARCGLGIRALQKNFLRHFDTTPHLYLRNLRLDKVRCLLQDTTAYWTVTAAALESGFVHLGRFSLCYRQRFGELPLATLARTRMSMGSGC